MCAEVTTVEPEWIALLRTERARGKSIAEIAREIGMKRTSLSLLINGKYPASLEKVTAKFEATVFMRYRAQVACPHLGRGIGAAECALYASAPMTMSSPSKLRHWRACQRCEHNPNGKELNNAC